MKSMLSLSLSSLWRASALRATSERTANLCWSSSARSSAGVSFPPPRTAHTASRSTSGWLRGARSACSGGRVCFPLRTLDSSAFAPACNAAACAFAFAWNAAACASAASRARAAATLTSLPSDSPSEDSASLLNHDMAATARPQREQACRRRANATARARALRRPPRDGAAWRACWPGRTDRAKSGVPIHSKPHVDSGAYVSFSVAAYQCAGEGWQLAGWICTNHMVSQMNDYHMGPALISRHGKC
eukprot:291965-Pleurochrysis_carterae.AAC.5